MPGNKTTSLPPIFRIGLAAKLLGVSTMTLRRWDKAGIFKGTPTGTRGDRRYTKEQILDALEHGIVRNT